MMYVKMIATYKCHYCHSKNNYAITECSDWSDVYEIQCPECKKKLQFKWWLGLQVSVLGDDREGA